MKLPRPPQRSRSRPRRRDRHLAWRSLADESKEVEESSCERPSEEELLGDDESRDVPVSRVSLKMYESKDGRGRRTRGEEERKRERRGVGQNRGGRSQTRLKGQGEL